MTRLSISQHQGLQQNQKLSYQRSIAITRSKILETPCDELVALLQEERQSNDFLEEMPPSNRGVNLKKVHRAEGFGPSSQAFPRPRSDLTDKHCGQLQNIPSVPMQSQELRETILQQLRDAKLDGEDIDEDFGESLVSEIDEFGMLSRSFAEIWEDFQNIEQKCNRTLRFALFTASSSSIPLG